MKYVVKLTKKKCKTYLICFKRKRKRKDIIEWEKKRREIIGDVGRSTGVA